MVGLLLMIVTVLLIAGAAATAHYLDRWSARRGSADEAAIERARQLWRSVNRGSHAVRRRRREAALAARLSRHAISRTRYHRAMSDLAAEDAIRCPVKVPRLRAE